MGNTAFTTTEGANVLLDRQMSVEGTAKVEVKSGAMASINGGAMTEIKGGLVRIN